MVDSSISGVTSNTRLPNKAPNPSLSDVRRCLPVCPADESLAGLVLDVSKAHRRVRIRPQDQGLLCFRHRDVLYQSVTLNFGARASGFYWNRVAGLLVRLAHRLWRIRHSALIYVDDLLAVLLRSSAPLLSALLVVLLCVLRVPMSWHKAALSARVTWIGWSFDFATFTVQLGPPKMQRLLDLLRQLSASPRCSVTMLEKLTGKLLWLSNMFPAYRPSLAPLYTDQHCPLPNMCGISADIYQALRSSLSADLRVTALLPLAAIPVGCKLLRVAHTPITSLKDVPEHISSRRVWVQVSNPLRPERELSQESQEVVRMWLSIASAPQPFRSLLFSVRYLSVKPLRMLARTPLQRAWGVLSVCLTADRLASRRPCPPPSLVTSFRGSLQIPLRSTALQLGKCWHRWHSSGFCPACCPQVMSLFTLSSVQITHLLSPRPGRALP